MSGPSRLLVALVASACLAVPAPALAQAPPAEPAGGVAPTGSTPGTVVTRPRLGTPVFSARRVPGLMRSEIADKRLAKATDALLAKAPETSCAVVTDHGRPVLRSKGETLVEPASTNKLLTGAAVLDAFGPDARLVTTVSAQGAPRDGVIEGNLWIVGGGDPILTTPGYQASFEYQDQTIHPYAQLAERLAAAGVREIRGDVIGDDSRYDDQRSVATWPSRYTRSDTVGPLSALMVNDGVTGYSDTPDKPSTVRKPGDPPALAAETLISYLRQRGVTVTGAASSGRAPGGLQEVARLESLPMRDLVTEMESWSDNTTAELLTKELGLKASGTGSTSAGTQAVRAYLEGRGLPTAGLVNNDGSGLDEGNRLSCDLLVGLLDQQGPDSELGRALAVAGERGTLRRRLRAEPTAGRVNAKTGTLTTPPVAALAGFVTTTKGNVLTFAFIQNGAKTDAGIADQFATVLASYPDAPDLAVLGPRPPVPGG